MRNLRLLTVFLAVPALLAFALAACGDDDDEDDTAPTATDVVAPLPTDANGGDGDGDGGAAPTATDVVAPLPTDSDGDGDGDGDGQALQLQVATANINFVPDALEAVAGEDFRILYANLQDGVSHNFAIFASEDDARGGGDPIAATTIESGLDTQVLLVAGLAAGDYFVWCQVHTSLMTATLTVE